MTSRLAREPSRVFSGVFSCLWKTLYYYGGEEMKGLKRMAGSAVAFLTALFVMGQNSALAAAPVVDKDKKTPSGQADVSSALEKAGITGTGNMSGLYTDLTGVVYFIMAIGGFWIVGMLVWGGMTLAGAGGNPQKRTEGFIKLSLVLVGAYIIFKAYDIASWATGLGGI